MDSACQTIHNRNTNRMRHLFFGQLRVNGTICWRGMGIVVSATMLGLLSIPCVFGEVIQDRHVRDGTGSFSVVEQPRTNGDEPSGKRSLQATVNGNVSTKPHLPNIVLILADDLGYCELGCYGQQMIRTPNLDRMAAEGMRFTQFYAGAPVCAPSRCVLMTGKHLGHAAIRDNSEVQPEGQWPLPAEEITIAEILKSQGYATAAIGKWGLGPPRSSGDPNSQEIGRAHV